jgi:predicted HNH restriction endonuclease
VRLKDVAARMPAVQQAAARAIVRIRAINSLDAESLAESLVGLEGELRRRMMTHRKREGWLRDARIALVKNRTGSLACEVKGCGFDYGTTYGELGENYAQVHHLRPLSDRAVPSKTRVSDLRVVCANCHAMIHLGGKSRSLRKISGALRAARHKARLRPA